MFNITLNAPLKHLELLRVHHSALYIDRRRLVVYLVASEPNESELQLIQWVLSIKDLKLHTLISTDDKSIDICIDHGAEDAIEDLLLCDI